MSRRGGSLGIGTDKNMKSISIGKLLILLFLCGSAFSQTSKPKKVRVNGVDLTYIESGTGVPIILLHGGQADYRAWGPVIPVLSPHFRVISYSRRYNFPNDNPITSNNHNAFVEAADLAAFVKKLGLKRVHLVGTSIGAFTALIFATDHPEKVLSLSLAEPNIHSWVKDSPAFKDFMNDVWNPAGRAFRAGDDLSGMRNLINGFGGAGTFERLPEAAVAVAMQNSRFFKAATLATDHSPEFSKEKVRRLKMPILIIRGENTFPMMRLIVDELERVRPDAERTVIVGAGHGSPREKPKEFAAAVISFLARNKFVPSSPQQQPGK
jgi:pimeloyl-ACP methyl ester carboxylesterase